jgi:hypothetical protein
MAVFVCTYSVQKPRATRKQSVSFGGLKGSKRQSSKIHIMILSLPRKKALPNMPDVGVQNLQARLASACTFPRDQHHPGPSAFSHHIISSSE